MFINLEKISFTLIDQLKNPWIRAVVTSFLVVIFILLFQPFDYNLLSTQIKTQIISGVAVETFIFSIGCHFISKHPGITTLTRIFIYLSMIIIFSQLLYLFTIAAGLNQFSLKGSVVYILSTAVIALIPMTFYLFIGLVSARNGQSPAIVKDTITLGEHTLYLSAIVLIKAEDNYIRIHTVDHAPLLVRGTLRETVKKTTNTMLFKVHRSFVVNLKAVKSITGNANGYKLRLKQYDEMVPVARSKGSLLKKKIKAIKH